MELAVHMEFDVHVTQDDIENGVPNMSTRCPIACAVKRILTERFPGYAVSVGTRTVTVYRIHSEKGKKDTYVFYEGSLPQEAIEFIYWFDFTDIITDAEASAFVRPFGFTIQLHGERK